MKLVYPNTRTVELTDNYHGTLVSDPYRWLEDVDSPETLEWIEQQNQLTFSLLESVPARKRIKTRLTEMWNFPKAWAPYKKGNRYFQERNSGLQNQNVLFVRESLDAEPRVLLDPNTLSADGTVALPSFAVSNDGNWLAYATSASGSDWLTWHIRKVETGDDLDEVIEWSKFSTAAWMPDHSGFYYSRYDMPLSLSMNVPIRRNGGSSPKSRRMVVITLSSSGMAPMYAIVFSIAMCEVKIRLWS
jgi:prolyl oligopeptidase